jgi:phage shock protein E
VDTNKPTTAELISLIKDGAVLIDVRNPDEYAAGHVANSTNIPLGEVPMRSEEFQFEKPVVVFCRSGVRSLQAKMMLNQMGIENIVNGGGWEDINQIVSQLN